MKLLSIVLVLFFVLANSCQKERKTIEIQSNLQDTLQKNDKKNIASIGVSLHSNAKKKIKNWKEYNLVDAMLTRYFAISNAEALSNAKELSSLVTHMKDSIRDEKLNTASFKARINVLHNECMRLNDMAIIPAISSEEVSLEIKKILEAYSAFNAKLNAIYTVNKLETELELDPDFIKILNDSITKPVPILKNSNLQQAKQKSKKNSAILNKVKNLQK